MIEIDLTCPNCGGRLEININIEKSFCPYCNSEFSVYRILNEKLKEVRKICQSFPDTPPYTMSSESIKDTELYKNLQTYLDIPSDEDAFFACDLSFWESGKKGFIIGKSGLYLRGDGMKTSRYLPWSQFKIASLYGISSLVIDDINFSSNEILNIRLCDLLRKIQKII